MSDERRNPWFKFFPTDWRADSGVRVSSLAARGLWLEMLCIMHEAPERGFLMVGASRIIGPKFLAQIIGMDEAKVAKAFEELERNGVFSRDNSGAVFSRKMVRDQRKSEVNSRNRRGAGDSDNSEENSVPSTNRSTNGATKEATKAPHHARAHDRDLEARGQSQKKTPPTPSLPGLAEPSGFDEFWKEYPRKVAKDGARKAYAAALARGASPAALLAACSAFADDVDEKRTEEKFIPHPATWLNQGRFADVAEAEVDIWTDPTFAEQREALRLHLKFGDWDSHAWGMKPPSPGCRFNRALLREHGIACDPWPARPLNPLIGE